MDDDEAALLRQPPRDLAVESRDAIPARGRSECQRREAELLQCALRGRPFDHPDVQKNFGSYHDRALTGEVGAGKTTICRALLDHLDSRFSTEYRVVDQSASVEVKLLRRGGFAASLVPL